MSVICTSERHDWCHVCGQRSDQTADIWYPRPDQGGGAEHADRDTHRLTYGYSGEVSYLRLCSACALTVVEIATAGERRSVIREPSRKRGRR